MRILAIQPGADTSVSDVYDGIVPALRRLGHDVGEYQLSRRWDRETDWLRFNYRRSVKANPELTKPTMADAVYLAGERIIPIALRANADWVLVISAMFLHPDWLVMLRRAGIPTAILFTESPYQDTEQAQVARFANIAWTNERTSVPFLRLVQPNTHYLPHAFDPAKHHPGGEDSDAPAHDCVFVGTAFRERVELLSAVDWSGIDLGLYGQWRSLASRHSLRRFVREGQIPNTKTAALYRKAKIGLNLYRTSTGAGGTTAAADSLNPRALELAACGVFHLSEYRAEVQEVFGPLVPTFTGPEELQALLRRFLPDDYERHRTAEALPARVADRTFDTMALTITADLRRTAAALEARKAVAA